MSLQAPHTLQPQAIVVDGDPCADHALHHAIAPTPSANGKIVYIVCPCGRRRAVWPEVWEAELERRKESGRG